MRTDFEILIDSLKGVEGYWACHTCKVTHPQRYVKDYTDYLSTNTPIIEYFKMKVMNNCPRCGVKLTKT